MRGAAPLPAQGTSSLRTLFRCRVAATLRFGPLAPSTGPQAKRRPPGSSHTCGMMNGMSALEQHTKVLTFIERWKDHGDEKQETQRFWIDLLQNVLGVEDALENTMFEYKTVGGGFIDVLCPEARLLVEQKGGKIDLDRPEERQGTMVTPVQQALRYADALPFSMKPAVLCTCNFRRFRFYDLDRDPRATGEPADEFALEELGDHLGTLTSIFSTEHSRMNVQQKLSEHAGVLVADLHNALASQYDDPDAPGSHHSLAVLTVRIVFCLYAEDAGLFPPNAFSDYVKGSDANHLRRAVIDLFQTLNTPKDRRDRYLEDELARFDYVNGGLFAEPIEIPRFTDKIRDAMIRAGDGFDWKDISPVIFGSLMEETLSHDQRRKGGMHYTTVKNIHKVIDPLFLDGLKAELDGILKRHEAELAMQRKKDDLATNYVSARARAKRHVTEFNVEGELYRFREKLGTLQFLDPACGSGNFLTETYLRLRELENRALSAELGGQGAINLGDDEDLVKVRIDQFHGIEINDFAVSVAKTALWIAEQQALDDTEDIAGQALPHLPLHDSGNIVQANALRYDWNELLPADECSYVMGNPPFIGQYLMNDEQKSDMKELMGHDYDGYLDYATGWHYKAAHYLDSTPDAAFAFVSTNSICQGQPVPALFKPLFSMGWRIHFAHRTFAWNAQSTDTAHVHVIIVGMTKNMNIKPRLFKYEDIQGDYAEHQVTNINGYLVDGPNVFVEKRSHPLSNVVEAAVKGSQATDGGGLMLDEESRIKVEADPIAAKYIRPFIGAKELINGSERYCLWMVDAQPSDLRKSTFLKQRVESVKEMRLASKKKQTRESATTSWLFTEIRQPDMSYLAIPRHFSGKREYATCRRFNSSIILGDACFLVPDNDGLAFAVIESSMFMIWQDAIGGRIKSDCRFSNTIVWNNLPLPQLSDELRQKVIDAGRGVIDARAGHEGQSLADLYDPDFMPADLRKAHQRLDKVVDAAFGAKKPCSSNDERLQVLFDRYVEMTKKEVR